MPTETKISWTDFSSNIIRYKDNTTGKDVWACAMTSPGCAHCYAAASAKRYGRGGPFTNEQVAKVTPYFSEDEAGKILRSKKLTGKRVFVGDMTDCFGSWVPDELIDQMFAVFALRPDVTFQLLTKRAERMAKYMQAVFQDGQTLRWGSADHFEGADLNAPLPNVWLGVSVENQHYADERIPPLLRTPAAVRFLSVEPMLGPVDLDAFFWQPMAIEDIPGWALNDGCSDGVQLRKKIHQVICGGESGPNFRPMNLDWARSLRDQCRSAGVPFFFKQASGPRPGMGEELDGEIIQEFPPKR